jgi:hypothetical protein
VYKLTRKVLLYDMKDLHSHNIRDKVCRKYQRYAIRVCVLLCSLSSHSTEEHFRAISVLLLWKYNSSNFNFHVVKPKRVSYCTNLKASNTKEEMNS